LLPACAVVTPVGHDAQAAAPGDDAKEPMAQSVQFCAPTGENVPTGQEAQLAAEAPK